jgi:TolB-like protein
MRPIIYINLLIIFTISAAAQEISQRDIAILPFISNGVDEASTITAESILRLELGKQKDVNLITEKRTLRPLNDEFCTDEECAKLIGEKLGVDQVVLCKLNLLGEKIIVQYFLVDVEKGDNVLAEQTTALNLDDLEPVMKRVAISIAKQSPFTSNVEVGNVVGNESIESLRRRSRYNFGVGFGYLFPQNGYDNDDKSFTINAYFDHEIDSYAVGLMAGARDGFAINIYGNYLFSNTDVCPYIGTSVGVHWVQHEENYGYYNTPNDVWYEPEEKSGNGIELGFKTGIRLLHTYNVQLFINLEFLMTFNDYDDKAIVFSIGIL